MYLVQWLSYVNRPHHLHRGLELIPVVMSQLIHGRGLHVHLVVVGSHHQNELLEDRDFAQSTMIRSQSCSLDYSQNTIWKMTGWVAKEFQPTTSVKSD